MNFDNTYARELEGAFAPWQPAQAPRPRELFFNEALAHELGGELAQWSIEQREATFSGNEIPQGAQPIAQAYAGHQFGGFSPQLGDGRALLLGEVIDAKGCRRDIALKGSGRTPFSRGGDGKAAVGPMLREVLIGEGLHAMGIPTTRALAVVATGDLVHRERPLPGAVLVRVADSHLRVGTFEFFAARGDTARLQRLLDYAMARHAPAAAQAQDPAMVLLEHVCRKQAMLVAQWMGVGFIHGVMNTDNMSISGQSIDFGPCAFMEVHDPATVYSSIDRQGRYAYGNQPAIAQWNVARLADALWPVMKGPEEEKLLGAQAVVQGFDAEFNRAMACIWSHKLGWGAPPDEPTREAARGLATAWQALMQEHQVDHTLGWRSLVKAAKGGLRLVTECFGGGAQHAAEWMERWRHETRAMNLEVDPSALSRANPFVIPRNHLVEAALAAAGHEGDMAPFNRLLAAIRRPWDEDEALQPYGEPAPPELATAHRTFCGT